MSQKGSRQAGSWRRLSKYREIVISIALFLVIDLGVLVMNFIIANQIESDAVSVNLAGRQRMLSQRTVKALLQLDNAVRRGEDIGLSLAELRDSYRLFDTTLNAFARGGPTVGADGEPVVVAAATTPQAQLLLQETQSIWQTYRSYLTPLLAGDLAGSANTANLLQPAIAFAVDNNLQLLTLMNDLTNEREEVATANANWLRTIQITGIILVTLNFFVILFHFLSRLRSSDSEVESVRKETSEILDTVSEGLFLLDKSGKIGNQYSRSVEQLLGNQQIAGRSLADVLRQIVPEKTLRTAEDYIGILFQTHVNENLVGSLNPLDQVEVHVDDGQGNYESRYLTFHFKRVLGQSGQLERILATVNDVTAQVALAQELEESHKRAEEQMDLLVKLLHVSPNALRDFLDRTDKGLEDINEVLKTRVHKRYRYKELLHNIFVIAHSIKGDASLLGLDLFESKTHEFEEKIHQLQNMEEISGNDMLGLTVKLNQLMETVGSVRGIVNRLTGLSSAFAAGSYGGDEPVEERHDILALDEIERLIQKLAESQGKEIKFERKGLEKLALPDTKLNTLRDVIVQLARNAVTHGIESPAERVERGKASAGTITLSCIVNDASHDLVFRDDGRGISVDHIRRTAIESGRYTEEELKEWDDRRIIGLMFEPGFSTSEEVTTGAGRGVGMDVIRRKIKQLGGRLKLANNPGKSCEWRIVLPTT